MSEKVRVLIYPTIGKPKDTYLDTLKGFQEVVEGNIEYVDLGFLTGYMQLRGYDLFCNEDGHNKNLPMNRVFKHSTVLGNFIISKANEMGDQISLNDDDILFIKKSLNIIGGIKEF